MATTEELVGRGLNVVLDQLYRTLFGDAVGNLRQGEEVTGEDVANSALTIGLNSLPGQVGRASKVTPEGLRSLAQLRTMIRRSDEPFTTPVPTATRGQAYNQAYGPGTYFSSRPASRDRWSYIGPNVQRLQTSPRGALQVARGRGFMDEAELARRMSANPRAAEATGLHDLQVNSPLVRQIMDEGYIGLSSNAGRSAGRRPLTINNEVQTLFDPASIPGARFKNLGKMDNATGLWENPTPIQAVENIARTAASRGAGMPTAAAKYMPMSELLNTAQRRAVNRVLARFGSRKNSAPIEPDI